MPKLSAFLIFFITRTFCERLGDTVFHKLPNADWQHIIFVGLVFRYLHLSLPGDVPISSAEQLLIRLPICPIVSTLKGLGSRST